MQYRPWLIPRVRVPLILSRIRKINLIIYIYSQDQTSFLLAKDGKIRPKYDPSMSRLQNGKFYI